MITFAYLYEKGSREINEDAIGYRVKEETACFALADGLGGHGRGEVASGCVVETAMAEYEQHGEEENFLADAFSVCQDVLMKKQRTQHATDEMKTTMVLCCITKDSIQWGHVGDSRLYLFEKRKLKARTEDHSVPQMLVYAGDIKEKQIRFHPDRNRLLKVMGVPWDKPEYELSSAHSRRGRQALLLCSDGFWEWIDEKQMSKCLAKAKSAAHWLELMKKNVEKNADTKTMDNYSALCIWCE